MAWMDSKRSREHRV